MDRKLPQGGRLNLVATLTLDPAGENITPPDPCATFQAFNTETGKTTAAVPLNFLPAVQRPQ